MEVNQVIILHFPLPIPGAASFFVFFFFWFRLTPLFYCDLVGLRQRLEHPIQHSKHNYPTGQYLQMIHQQVLRAGHMEIIHPYQLRHGGLLRLKLLLRLKHLHGVNHRVIHGGYLGRPVVHGERRLQHLMALQQHHTPLGLNNPNDLRLNRVYLSIRLSDNPLPPDGLVLGTKEQ